MRANVQLGGQRAFDVAHRLHSRPCVRVALVYLAVPRLDVSVENLRREIEHHGHQIVCEIGKDLNFAGLLSSVDLVAVAGGDGSVASVARSLVGKRIPIAVLPLGTANNIAKCLAVPVALEDAIASWDRDRRVPFDFGVARGPWGERYFLEGVGGGLLPAVMTACHDVEVETALRAHAELLSCLEPLPFEIVVDDERIEGEFLLVEVLNTGWIGPNLALALHSNPADGWLEIVTVEEEERQTLVDYVYKRLHGAPPSTPLPVRQARAVRVRAAEEVHIDDQLHPGGLIDIVVQPRVVEFLV